MNKAFFTRNHIIYFLFALFFVGLFATIETINGKFYTNDLRVYYSAVRDFFAGNNPYEKAYGLETGYFKYPPTTLYLFSYFQFVSFSAAQIIHLIISAISLMISLPLLKQSIQKKVLEDSKKYTYLIYIAFIGIFVHLGREFHMGNINLILLGLFSLGFSKLDATNNWTTVITWSLMIILKPIMILAILPLVFFKRWKQFFAIGLCGILFFITPMFHKGFSGNLLLWTDWLSAVSEHGDYISSYNSFKYMSKFYFGWISNWGLSLIGLFALVAIMIWTLTRYKAEKLLSNWIVIFLAFIPNFFVTDTEHFMLTAPLILFTAARLIKAKSKFGWAIFIVALIPLSFNTMDFLGRKLSDDFDRYAATGLGNFTFILLFLTLFLCQTKKESNLHSTPSNSSTN